MVDRPYIRMRRKEPRKKRIAGTTWFFIAQYAAFILMVAGFCVFLYLAWSSING